MFYKIRLYALLYRKIFLKVLGEKYLMHFTFSPGSKFLGSFISHYDPKYKDDGNIIIFSEKNNPLIKPTPRHRKKKPCTNERFGT